MNNKVQYMFTLQTPRPVTKFPERNQAHLGMEPSKNQPNKMGMTPQYFHNIPTSYTRKRFTICTVTNVALAATASVNLQIISVKLGTTRFEVFFVGV